MKKFLSTVLIICISVGLTACAGDKTQDAQQSSPNNALENTDEIVVIKMGAEGQAGLPDTICGEKFKEAVEELSGGRIIVDYYTGGQLGGDTELLEQVMGGAIDAAVISTSAFSEYTPELDALQLPFLLDTYEKEAKAFQTEEAKALLNQLEVLKVKGLTLCEIGSRHFANNIKPIEKLEDLKGIKMRVVPSNLVKESAEKLGMTVTPMSYTEIYTGLQQKVIEGEEINLISISEERHYEVLKYVSLIGFYPFPSLVCMNLDVYNKFSDEDKAIIEEASNIAFEFTMKQVQIAEDEALQIILDNGLEVNEIENIDEFKAAVADIYEEYAAKSETMAAFIEMAKNLE